MQGLPALGSGPIQIRGPQLALWPQILKLSAVVIMSARTVASAMRRPRQQPLNLLLVTVLPTRKPVSRVTLTRGLPNTETDSTSRGLELVRIVTAILAFKQEEISAEINPQIAGIKVITIRGGTLVSTSEETLTCGRLKKVL